MLWSWEEEACSHACMLIIGISCCFKIKRNKGHVLGDLKFDQSLIGLIYLITSLFGSIDVRFIYKNLIKNRVLKDMVHISLIIRNKRHMPLFYTNTNEYVLLHSSAIYACMIHHIKTFLSSTTFKAARTCVCVQIYMG